MDLGSMPIMTEILMAISNSIKDFWYVIVFMPFILWGSVIALGLLGNMYEDGQVVEQSDLEFYKWYSLISLYIESEGYSWGKLKNGLYKIYLGFKLDSTQIKEADEWVKNWKPKK